MEKLSMCRICLIKDVRLHCLVNSHLQEIYEFLFGNLLETKDTRPLHACDMCCARHCNCLQLRTACLHSEELFSHLLENDSSHSPASERTVPRCEDRQFSTGDSCEVSHSTCSMHVVVLYLLSPTDNNKDLFADLKDDIIEDEGLFCQIIKQEDVNPENASSEDEELDYSIQSTKAQASDNFCVGDGSLNSDITKSNHSISSADLQHICAKTIKIVLHRMDLNTTTVTEHLNPTDLEYTSQCNNYSDNVEMLSPNTCEEYKQTVHTSSDITCSPNSDSFKHIRTHTGDAIYKCRICEKSFSKQSVLNVHFRRTHKKPYICEKYGRCFTYKCYLLIHIRTHTGEKPYKCDTCGNGFTRKDNLSCHIRTHTGDKSFPCPTCDKSFKRICDLIEHVRTHRGEKPYKRDTCGKGFTRKDNLSCHIRTHTGDKPFPCPTCDKSFNRSCDLIEHTRTHTGEKRFRCPTCDKGFNQSSHLTEHVRTHTGEKPYKCDTCGIGFTKKGKLSCHIRSHTGEKPFRCPTCDKGFNNSSYLTKHVRTHTGDFGNGNKIITL